LLNEVLQLVAGDIRLAIVHPIQRRLKLTLQTLRLLPGQLGLILQRLDPIDQILDYLRW
jgi:hypothetical protein